MKKLAFIRVGALGDVLVSLAALEVVCEENPDHETWVIGLPVFREVLFPSAWPRVARFIETDKKARFAREFKAENGRWVEVKKTRSLKEALAECHTSIDLRIESNRFGLLAFRAGVIKRYGCCPWYLGWLYTHWSPWLGMTPIIHERDRMLRVLEAREHTPWFFKTCQGNRKALREEQSHGNHKRNKFLVEQPGQAPSSLAYRYFKKGLPPIKTDNEIRPFEIHGKYPGYLLINPTASDRLKAWPAEKFKTFIRAIEGFAEKNRLSLVVTGAPSETSWLLETVAEENIVQPPGISELVDLVAGASMLVANTSSVQFIANCMKVPAFVFMGRTYPARWGPLGSKDSFIYGKIPANFKGTIY